MWKKRPTLVTAAIIEREGMYLLTQRPDDGRQNSGEWEFPGGEIEFGEHPRPCLEREIREELGISIEAGDLFEVSSHVYRDDLHVLLLGIHCKYISGEIQMKDINGWEWVSPRNMGNYNISTPDIVFVEKLKVSSQ